MAARVVQGRVAEAVRFYFDFVSPYSYLAVMRLESAHLPREVDLRPVALGSIFAKLGVSPPGENPVRRRAVLADLLLLCQAYGLPFAGPPAHPFNSIYALRSVAAIDDAALRWRLCRRYFELAWGDGRSLEDLAVLRDALSELGIAQDPEEAATTVENRRRLRANTQELLELGGFGVPTFVADGALFFGHDRLELLRRFLAGHVTLDAERHAALLARPMGGRGG